MPTRKNPTIHKSEKNTHKAKVLCVDDESMILEGLELNLRQTAKVTTADGGHAAIEILKRNDDFDIIISDMRMPEMDGATFLKKARQLAPQAVRILLTGHADLDAAMRAVNEGKIFRYLNKPCPKNDLVEIIKLAMEEKHKGDIQRDIMENTLKASVRVLSEAMGLASPLAFSTSNRAEKMVKRLCRHFAIPETWEFEIAALLSQIGCITVPMEVLNKYASNMELTGDEWASYCGHMEAARNLLERIPRLERVAYIVGGQLTPWNETTFSFDGEDDLIQLGQQLLRACLRFDLGLDNEAEVAAIINEMKAETPPYPPELLDAFFHIDFPPDTFVEKTVTPEELCTGMLVKTPVDTLHGVTLATAGTRLDFNDIQRICQFSKEPGIILPLHVYIRI
ncbi:MAG: response regulator [Myxococcota bacterium]|nr:response regulator [Myxococcota bacterium]